MGNDLYVRPSSKRDKQAVVAVKDKAKLGLKLLDLSKSIKIKDRSGAIEHIIKHPEFIEFFHQLQKRYKVHADKKSASLDQFSEMVLDFLFHVYFQKLKHSKLSSRRTSYDHSKHMKKIITYSKKLNALLTDMPHIEQLLHESDSVHQLQINLNVLPLILQNFKGQPMPTVLEDAKMPLNYKGKSGQRNAFVLEVDAFLFKIFGKHLASEIALITSAFYQDHSNPLSYDSIKKLVKTSVSPKLAR